jgi:UDP-glucose:(heptosyl)LPS alpha-1,3-glucosyltransferase
VKIAIVIENLSPHRGGAEVYTLWLVRKLMEAGHDVTVLAGQCGYPDIKFLPVPARGVGRAWRALSFARDACRLVEAGGYDVSVDMGRSYGARLHQTHNGCLPAATRANRMAEPNPWLRRLRAAMEAVSLKQQAHAFIEAERVRRGTHIIALSKFVAEDWRRFYGIPAERLHIVHNGVDIAKFRPGPTKPPDSPVTILCVAQNFRRKGVFYLLKAAQLLARTAPGRWRVQIVGLGYASGRRYERLAASLGVRHCVEFVGESNDIAGVYAAADVFCLPTFYDPCPLVVLEALAAGLPVVTTRFDGAGELMTNGQEGFILDDPRDAAALAGALTKLLDKPTRARMSAAARQLAGRHTSDRNFEEILAVFRRVAGEAR